MKKYDLYQEKKIYDSAIDEFICKMETEQAYCLETLKCYMHKSQTVEQKIIKKEQQEREKRFKV